MVPVVRLRGNQHDQGVELGACEANPEGSFQSPLSIVDEELFTRGEKLATLNRWRNTRRALVREPVSSEK
jgi:hypothetical protein